MSLFQTNRWLIIPAALIGVVVFVYMVKNKAQPDVVVLEESSRAVRIIPVPRVNVVPVIRGTGTVKPGNTWNGVAQVSGKIIEMNPRLKKGAMIPAGSVLLKIDPSDYELAIAQAETAIEASKAQLADSRIREKNAKASLKIEQQALSIGEKELERKRKLRLEGSVTASDFEREQRNVLAQQQSVQNLRNSINLFPTEVQRLNADINRLKAQLASAKLNLERTTLIMPFNGRVAESKTEIQQYARQGDILAIVDGIDKAEIEVQIPMVRLSTLIRGIGIVDINQVEDSNIGKLLGIDAMVRLTRDDLHVSWDAKVVRISDTLDPRTRTVGVIVEVNNPYANIQPGVRPPLGKGLFVEVIFKGTTKPGQLVVPIDAIHQNSVYIVNQENRLQIRKVDLDIKNGSYVVVKNGIKAGEQLIVSDLIPAIEGMKLTSEVDETAATKLKHAAMGLDSGRSL